MHNLDLTTVIAGISFKNPFIAASGTYGFGEEASQFLDLSLWGGLVAKGTTLEPRAGNPGPRVMETAAGMLNSVGLQNPGVDVLIAEHWPRMRKLPTTMVLNVAGRTIEDYLKTCEKLEAIDAPVIELNLSCPNVQAGCMSFGADPSQIEHITKAVKQISQKKIWVKLTPNVTSIEDVARAAEAGGADAISLINTVMGMAIDIQTKRPILKNNTGGLSGPCIKPIALRMVHAVRQCVSCPIIGMGGISSASDAIEFMLAGADAVQIGTHNLVHPTGIQRIVADFVDWMQNQGYQHPSELVGQLELW